MHLRGDERSLCPLQSRLLGNRVRLRASNQTSTLAAEITLRWRSVRWTHRKGVEAGGVVARSAHAAHSLHPLCQSRCRDVCRSFDLRPATAPDAHGEIFRETLRRRTVWQGTLHRGHRKHGHHRRRVRVDRRFVYYQDRS